MVFSLKSLLLFQLEISVMKQNPAGNGGIFYWNCKPWVVKKCWDHSLWQDILTPKSLSKADYSDIATFKNK